MSHIEALRAKHEEICRVIAHLEMLAKLHSTRLSLPTPAEVEAMHSIVEAREAL